MTLALLFIALTLNAASAAEISDNNTAQLSNNSSTINTTTSAAKSSSTVVISGEVKQCSDGDPFPGVTVTVSKDGTELASTTTNENGTYYLSFSSNARVFNVTASYPGHNSVTKEVSVNSNENNPLYGTEDFKLGQDNVWVDPINGKDSNSGSAAKPFKTIEKAFSKVNENGVIWLYNGIYSGTGNVNLTIDKNITIKSYEVNPIIDGGGNSQIFIIPNADKDLTVTIRDITLTGGSDLSGGAIEVILGLSNPHTHTLNLNYCTFINNHASGSGGAIYCWGSNLNLYKCTFTGNTAPHGGAVNVDGYLNVKNCTFTNNSATEGGAIWGNTGSVTITNSTFNSNKATNSNWGYGGGAIGTKCNLYVTDCTFTDNAATYDGASIWNKAYVSINNCTFTKNHSESGTIWNTVDGTCKITGSDFINNIANYGAAIENYGTMTIDTSNFTGNTASYGGAISYLGKNLTITNSNFTNNNATNGGAIWNDYNTHSSTGPFNINECIFTGNTATGQGSIIWNNREFRYRCNALQPHIWKYRKLRCIFRWWNYKCREQLVG